jgi:lipoprotein-releasing system permease protein
MLFKFASRFVFSKKQTKSINIISWVSISSIAIGTAALLIVLSVFNGIEGFIKTMYSNFYTDAKITTIDNTPFEFNNIVYQYLQQQKGVKNIGKSFEESVLISVDNIQNIISLKGVDEQYAKITHLSSIVKYGDTNIFDDQSRILVGMGIANRMGISEQSITPLSLYSFSKDSNQTELATAYTEAKFYTTGVFAVQDEFDSKYCFANLKTVQNFFSLPNSITAFDIQFSTEKEAELFVENSKSFLNQFGLKAQTRYEQNKTLYYVLKSEKWMVFAILSFIILIASFNMIGSLSLLVLEKKQDIKILYALGNSESNTKNIFLFTGILICLVGAAIGLIIALIICLLQQKYGFVTMAGDSFLLSAYPVKLLLSDFILVIATVACIGFIASYFPSRRAEIQ